MKRAFQLIVIVVLMFGLALFAAPFWLGKQTETAFSEVIKNVAAKKGLPSSHYTFDRGWIRSDAKNDFLLPTAPITIHATHRLEHGPFPLSRLLKGNALPVLAIIETTLRVSASPDAPANLAKTLSSLPPLKMTTVLDLSGDGSTYLHVDAATQKLEKSSIQWDSGEGQLIFDRDWKKVKLEFRMPKISVRTSRGTLDINNALLSSDMYEGAAGYMFGRNSFSISSLSVNPFMEMKNLRLTAIAQQKGTFVNFNISYSIEALTIAKDNYGPGKFNLVIRNLDTKILSQFEKELNGIYSRALPKEQSQMIIVGKTLELAGKLSKFNPEIEVTRLSFATSEGNLTGKAKFVVQGQGSDLSANPMLLLTAVKGSAEIVIPSSLAKAFVMPQIQRDITSLGKEGKLKNADASQLTAETLSQIADEVYPKYLQESGFGRWFVKREKDYRFSVSIDRGKVTVNGVPLPAGL